MKELERLVIWETSTACKTIWPPTMGKDKTKDKEHHDGEAATSETNSPWDAHWDTHQDTWDLSRDHEAWDAALAQTITEAATREMAKAHAHYQAILNEKNASTLQISHKVSSGANGFKVMDPFDWTKDKSIYQRCQLWSEKARLALDAKYLHVCIDYLSKIVKYPLVIYTWLCRVVISSSKPFSYSYFCLNHFFLLFCTSHLFNLFTNFHLIYEV